jgi:hypothetical protein
MISHDLGAVIRDVSSLPSFVSQMLNERCQLIQEELKRMQEVCIKV